LNQRILWIVAAALLVIAMIGYIVRD